MVSRRGFFTGIGVAALSGCAPSGIEERPGARFAAPWWDLLESSELVDIGLCGGIGDGSADDTAAFLAFRSYVVHALGDGTRAPDWLVTLRLSPGGHYRVSDNRWCRGIPRLCILGNGAKLETLGGTAFGMGGWFSGSGDARSYGDPIRTVAAGGRTVPLSRPADAAGYAAGDAVLIGGHDLAPGGPRPDYRLFEYREVAGVDAASGTVTLTEALAHGYDAGWPGPARMLRLGRRGLALCRYWEITDLVLLPDRNRPDQSVAGFEGALHIVARNVDTTRIARTDFAEARVIECRDCAFGPVEGGTLVERVGLHDCDIRGDFTGFAGVRHLEVNRGRIGGGRWSVAARSQSVRGTRLDNLTPRSARALIRLNDGAPTHHISEAVFDGVEVLGPNDRQLWDVEDDPPFRALTFRALAGERLLVPAGSGRQALPCPGQCMVSTDGASLCEVRNVVAHDARRHAIEVDWLSAVPAPPVTLWFATNAGLRLANGNARAAWQREGDLIRLRWTDRDPFWDGSPRRVPVCGVVRAVRVNVLRPASGPSGSQKLRIGDPSRGRVLCEIDLTGAGYREVTANGIAGRAGSDAFTPAGWCVLVPDLVIGPRRGGAWGLSPNRAENPRLTVEMEVDAWA